MKADQQNFELQTALVQFRRVLNANNKALEKISQLEQTLGGEFIFDQAFIRNSGKELISLVRQIINNLNILSDQHYTDLWHPFTTISNHISDIAGGGPGTFDQFVVLPYQHLHRDLDYLVGIENSVLGEIKNEFELSIPDGFTITKNGYDLSLNQHDTLEQIDKTLILDITADKKAEEINRLIRPLLFPDKLIKAIDKSLKQLHTQNPEVKKLAIRSSIIGRDGDRNIGGQFQCIRHVKPDLENVLAAYRDMLYSRFDAQVIEYLGVEATANDFPVAVAVQCVEPRDCDGIVYTLDPDSPKNNRLLVNATRDTAEDDVAGHRQVDRYSLDRLKQSHMTKSEIRIQATEWERSQDKRTASGILLRGSAVLTPDQLQRILEISLLLEKSFYYPQEIEWTIFNDKITVLQSRPLKINFPPAPSAEEIMEELERSPVLMKDKGRPVQLGARSGIVFHISEQTKASSFPVGAIAVSHWSSPELSWIVKKAAAIITDVGSPTGHLATIAREYNTPALFGTEIATKNLIQGQTVTIDVENRTVYEGTIKGLISHELTDDDILHQSSELRILRRILRWVAPLNLTNPRSDEFKPEYCKTFHDIIRFSHEKAVSTIINFHGRFKQRMNVLKHELSNVTPFPMKIIDLGEGIVSNAKNEINPDQVLSTPFKAILKGLSNRQVWSTDPVAFGFKDIMSSLSKPMNWLAETPEYQGENLALIAKDYCNLSLRLGYHFNIIDSFVSQQPENNYIYFRFAGGFSETLKLQRRVEFINLVLISLRFKTEKKGDLIVGKIKMLEVDDISEILMRLGELAVFSRQLDAQMKHDKAVDVLFSEFLEKCQPKTP